MASLLTKPTVIRGRDEVYVAAVPLRATKGPAQLLTSAAYSLNLWNLQHFMVIINPSPPPPDCQAIVFDFQPKDPENLYAALAVLSGKAIPGVVLMRKLSKLPRRKCWYVGSPKGSGAIDMALEFNKQWETKLRVGHHDCRNYTNGLVEYLTDEEHILERLEGKRRH
ncbi:hypothetical protein ACFX1X_046215 [Malus domestica]